MKKVPLAPIFEVKTLPIGKLSLDVKNPRLPEDGKISTQDELVEYVARWYESISIARSIAAHGFFQSEPLIAVVEGRRHVVVEGNRRLAALKLLGSEQLRDRIDIDDKEEWDELALSLYIPAEVPVVVVPNRTSVAPIIGYRHISGIEPWDPWAKARFISFLLEDQGMDFPEVASVVGEKENDVRAHYRNYRIIVTARDEARISTRRAEDNFGIFTRSMTSGGVRDFIGSPPPSGVTKQGRVIPGDKLRSLAELFGWLFGSDKDEPVISESREITDLGTVLSSSEGLKVLRRTRDLSEAFSAAGGLRLRLIGRLTNALSNLRRAEEDIDDYWDDEEVQGLLDECQKAISGLVESE